MSVERLTEDKIDRRVIDPLDECGVEAGYVHGSWYLTYSRSVTLQYSSHNPVNVTIHVEIGIFTLFIDRNLYLV